MRLGPATETPLRHVVLLMRENRSFDHYFGRFPGADGLPAGAPITHSSTDCLSDPPHDEATFQSLSGGAQFAGPAALSVFDEPDIPLAWAMARRFTLCDRYFASVLGPTFPNRLFSVAASAGGFRANPARIDATLLPRPNLVDRLDAAKLDWACYLAKVPDEHGYNAVAFYPERASDPRANRSFTDFLADAASGRLPAVSWVVPQDPLSEHPPTPPRWGQRFAALAVSAVAAGPQWHQSAVVLNYDESGGFYDHVAPPADRGYRVPCVVASPYAKPGHVSHAAYDHASALALVERTFGLAPLTEADAAASPFDDCFDFSSPDSGPLALPAQSMQLSCETPPAWAADLLAMPLPQPTGAAASQPWGELAVGLGGLSGALATGLLIGLRASNRGSYPR